MNRRGPSIQERASRRRGFTLIELLAAVAIIGVLLAIAFATAKSAIAVAHSARCTGNLRQLTTGVLQYAQEHNGMLPPVTLWFKDSNGGPNYRLWMQLLWYADATKGAPSDEGILSRPTLEEGRAARSVFQCPANPGRIGHWDTPNYAYNSALGMDSYDKNTQEIIMDRVHLGNIPQPGKTVCFVDAGERPDQTPASGGPPFVTYYVTEYTSYSRWEASVNFIHKGRANFGMVDGHVESLTREDIQERTDKKTLFWSRDNARIPDGIW